MAYRGPRHRSQALESPSVILPDQGINLTVRIFQVQPVAFFQNFENIFAELDTADAVRSFTPDFNAIAALGPVGLAVTGRADFVSR